MILEPALYPNHDPKLSDPILGITNPVPKLRGRVAELLACGHGYAPILPDGRIRAIRLEIAAETVMDATVAYLEVVFANVYLTNPCCVLDLVEEGVLIHAITDCCECSPLAQRRLA